MRPVLVTLCLMAVSACTPGGEAQTRTAATIDPPVVLGGVDLNQPVRAIGTEPFWDVAITPDALVYSGLEQAERRADNPGPVVRGTTAVYVASANGAPVMVVTLIATECSDGMSDRTYPLTAMIEIGERKLNGCAASQVFLASTSETGAPG